MSVEAPVSTEQPNDRPNAGELFDKLYYGAPIENTEKPEKPPKYVGRHRKTDSQTAVEGPTRRDIKAALTPEERRNLKQASKIVRRVMGRTALPMFEDVKPLEPLSERGTYTDEAIDIATERLHKPYGIDVVVHDSDRFDADQTDYDAEYDPGIKEKPYRVVRVVGINEHANHTPTSHRK